MKLKIAEIRQGDMKIRRYKRRIMYIMYSLMVIRYAHTLNYT